LPADEVVEPAAVPPSPELPAAAGAALLAFEVLGGETAAAHESPAAALITAAVLTATLAMTRRWVARDMRRLSVIAAAVMGTVVVSRVVVPPGGRGAGHACRDWSHHGCRGRRRDW
jgi:hypothetical protein